MPSREDIELELKKVSEAHPNDEPNDVAIMQRNAVRVYLSGHYPDTTRGWTTIDLIVADLGSYQEYVLH